MRNNNQDIRYRVGKKKKEKNKQIEDRTGKEEGFSEEGFHSFIYSTLSEHLLYPQPYANHKYRKQSLLNSYSKTLPRKTRWSTFK